MIYLPTNHYEHYVTIVLYELANSNNICKQPYDSIENGKVSITVDTK